MRSGARGSGGGRAPKAGPAVVRGGQAAGGGRVRAGLGWAAVTAHLAGDGLRGCCGQRAASGLACEVQG